MLLRHMPHNRPRHGSGQLVLLLRYVGLLILLAGVFGFTVQTSLKSVGSLDAPQQRVTIPADSTSRAIACLLQEKGLIRSEAAFRLFVRYKGLDSQLKAGEYDLSSALSTPVIVDKLVRGQPVTECFTIPEGYNTRQIASLLEDAGLADEQEFMKTVVGDHFSYPFLTESPAGPRRLEGYLFPDTYRVARNVRPHTIVECMLARFNAENERLQLETKAARLGLSLHEVVVLASLIEREVQHDDERALVSGVLHNRLHLGMPLQVDATVLYALGRTSADQVTFEDLKVDSPYNTYLVTGLPPGAIANPGSASLWAAVHPKTTSYLYYVAKPDGSHAFARSLDEHNQNQARFQG